VVYSKAVRSWQNLFRFGTRELLEPSAQQHPEEILNSTLQALDPLLNIVQLKMAQKCVHQSCGKMYTNPEEECQYHSGPPIFHEGQKGELDSNYNGVPDPTICTRN